MLPVDADANIRIALKISKRCFARHIVSSLEQPQLPASIRDRWC